MELSAHLAGVHIADGGRAPPRRQLIGTAGACAVKGCCPSRSDGSKGGRWGIIRGLPTEQQAPLDLGWETGQIAILKEGRSFGGRELFNAAAQELAFNASASNLRGLHSGGRLTAPPPSA